jgi:hypothetical protein
LAEPTVPLPDPQATPVLVIYPELSICTQLCPLLAARPGNAIDVGPVKLAYNELLLPPYTLNAVPAPVS